MCDISLGHLILIDFNSVLVHIFSGNRKASGFAGYRSRGLQYHHDYKFRGFNGSEHSCCDLLFHDTVQSITKIATYQAPWCHYQQNYNMNRHNSNCLHVKVIPTEFVEMVVMYLHTGFHKSVSSTSLVTGMKLIYSFLAIGKGPVYFYFYSGRSFTRGTSCLKLYYHKKEFHAAYWSSDSSISSNMCSCYWCYRFKLHEGKLESVFTMFHKNLSTC
jgi:hypothetical protein